MADIKLSDLFGGVGSMSDQVIKNRDDIITIKADVATKVTNTGGDINGKLRVIRSGSGWPNDTANDGNNFANRAIESIVTGNNAIHFFGDGNTNARRLGIQAGHSDPAYATSYGTLDLNPFGGAVRANGHQVYTPGYKQPDIPCQDVRDVDRKPNYFAKSTLTSWFNQRGVPQDGTWYSGINVKGWADDYTSWQLMSFSSTGASDNKLWFRTGKDAVWNTTYEVYHSGRKPSPGDLGAYTKAEVDNTFARKGGDTFTGTITSSATHAASTAGAQIHHFGNGTSGQPINLRSMREHNSSTWVWEKVAGGQLRYSTGTNGGGEDRITLDVQNGNIKTAGEYIGLKADNLRIAYGGYGVFWRNDGNQHYLMVTNKDDMYGTYNSLRPFYFNVTTGFVSCGHKLTSPILNATGTASGQGIVFNEKTAIGGANDSWLRINPHSQFSNGVYCGPTGTLRHDGSLQRGGWGENTSAIMRPATDGGWGVNGNSAFSYIQNNSNSAHWLLGSYKDSSTIRCGIHVLTADSGVMRFYTNLRNNYVQVDGGNLTAQNNVVAYSDIRVKKNIEVIENALAKTLSLRGVTYDRTDQDGARQTGLIAQEVEAILPEAVITSVNGDIKDFKSVAYGNLVGLLVESIRELNTRIEYLESKIKE